MDILLSYIACYVNIIMRQLIREKRDEIGWATHGLFLTKVAMITAPPFVYKKILFSITE